MDKKDLRLLALDITIYQVQINELKTQVSALSTTTYALISYTYKDFTMVYNQTLGNSGSALFPVLPTNIKMVLGNLETGNETQVVATITYYY